MIDAENVCYRTQVALRIVCVPKAKWQAFVDGMDDGEAEQTKVDQLLVSLLKEYEKTAKRMELEVHALKVGQDGQRDMLSRRWRQIRDLDSKHNRAP